MPRRPLAAVPDHPRRVVAYRRVSALMGRAGDDFYSPDLQLAAIRRVTAGLHEIAVIDDIDITGRTFARKGIKRIKAMAEGQQIDAIAVYDVSRLGRNVRESLIFLNWLADRGVVVLSACEQVDTSTPAGRLMLTNMLAIAEYRSDEIGRGWSAVIASRAAAGHHPGRNIGYTRANKQLIPHPVEGPMMTEVFRRYAAGDRLADICRYLAAVRSRPILAGNLKTMLRNQAYLGHVVSRGEVLPGIHEPLVDDDTWRRVQDRLALESRTPSRVLAYAWSLVGLCRCPAGHNVQRQPHVRKSGLREVRLVCGGRRTDLYGGTCEGIGRPLLELVEAEALRQVAEYAARLRDDHVSRAARLTRLTRARADRTGLERELERTRAAMRKLTKEWASGPMPDDLYRDTLAEFKHSEAMAMAEIARLDTGDVPPDPIEAATAVEVMLAMWPDMTAAERGKALRSVVDWIEVRRAAYWREPEDQRVDVHFRW